MVHKAEITTVMEEQGGMWYTRHRRICRKCNTTQSSESTPLHLSAHQPSLSLHIKGSVKDGHELGGSYSASKHISWEGGGIKSTHLPTYLPTYLYTHPPTLVHIIGTSPTSTCITMKGREGGGCPRHTHSTLTYGQVPPRIERWARLEYAC